MKPKSLNVHCFDIFVALVEKRRQFEDEYYSNPTWEKKTRLDSLRKLIKQYEAITRGRPILNLWN